MSGAGLLHLIWLARRKRRPRRAATEEERRLVRRLWVDDEVPRDQLEHHLRLHGVSSERAAQLAHCDLISVREAIHAGRFRMILGGLIGAMVLLMGIALLAERELTSGADAMLTVALMVSAWFFVAGLRAVGDAREVERLDAGPGPAANRQ